MKVITYFFNDDCVSGNQVMKILTSIEDDIDPKDTDYRASKINLGDDE